MSRTFRRQPDGVWGMREKVRTRSERLGRERAFDEAFDAGYGLSTRRRKLRDRWDDIPISAAKEGRWYK